MRLNRCRRVAVFHNLLLLTLSLSLFGLRAGAQCGPSIVAIELTSSAQTAPVGIPITFTAKANLSEAVTFYDFGLAIPGSTTITGIFTAALPPGFHSITAGAGNCGVTYLSNGVTVLVGQSQPPLPPAPSQFVQQGGKIVVPGSTLLGASVALAGDGNTAVVSGNSNAGNGAWIFTRSGGTWTQGPLLVSPREPSDAVGSVAISGDGNTVLIAYSDPNAVIRGAVWAFTATNASWLTPQASPVLDPGPGPFGSQGPSVAISADGNTAVLREPDENSSSGQAWVFGRANNAWTLEAKLAGSDSASFDRDGETVAISGDGQTVAVVGQRLIRVFTGTGGGWTQQSPELGSSAGLSSSVALSGDGNTLITGSINAGAAFVYTRSNGVWSAPPALLTGAGQNGTSYFGGSVAISSDGRTALVADPLDSGGAGAAWVFSNGVGGWQQVGSKLVGSGAVYPPWPGCIYSFCPLFGAPTEASSVALSADGSTVLVGALTGTILRQALHGYSPPKPLLPLPRRHPASPSRSTRARHPSTNPSP